jgi:hypothetical protein
MSATGNGANGGKSQGGTPDDRTVVVSGFAAAPGDARLTPQNALPPGDAGMTPRTILPPNNAAPTPHNILPPGTRLGEFEIAGLIGEGGFGIVYLALDTSLGRHVALKEYMPSALAARIGATQVQVRSERYEGMFLAGLKSFINDEARLLARFDHQSLVKVYRFWEANGTAYMVMPYYKGVTLKDALRSMKRPPDEAWLRALLAPLVEALAVLHASDCFHRDVAPDNIILLEGSQRPVLLDFGAARRVIGDMTQALTVILKPGYAPIEQYAEVPSLRQGPWTDLYALAALVHFAITGKTPPPSVGRMVSDTYQPLAKLAAGRYSERFLKAIDHALAVQPAHRPTSCRQFADELGIVIDAASASPPNDRAEHDGARRRGWALGAAGVLLVVVAAAGVGWFVKRPVVPHVQQAPVAQQAPAPAPAAPAVAQTPPLPPYTAASEFERIVTLADPSISVKVEVPIPRAIVDKDPLRFNVTSNHDGYLYIFAVDPDNQYTQLFPNELDHDNRVTARKRLVLPRANWTLYAQDTPGTNHFIAIVSLAPRDFAALGMTQDDSFKTLAAAAQNAAAAQRSVDASPFAGVPACSADASACPREFGAATFKIDIVRSSK